ncbi:MAG: hypothetical protein IPG24_23130 [Leptospiraceae bacterium]|nr:hypothetical protein [Leptospiraceae bacterium]
MKLNKESITETIPYLIYLLLIVFIFKFRFELDKKNLYITSDGAIKLYQTVQYKEKGFLSLECLYPGKSFDEEYKHFPISYPWAIFQTRGMKCVLEYPPFFYWIGSVFLKIFPLNLILYLPLLFYAGNILFFDFILRRMGLIDIFRVFLVTLGFISFSLLTAMDYTENPAFQTFYLLGFYFFWKYGKEDNVKYAQLILTGILFGLAFILRLEILMTFSILCFIYFLFTLNLKKPFFIYLGFTIVGILFVIYNLQVSGHPLGFRYVSSIDFNENAKADIGKRLMLLKAAIWGDEVMVGVFKFQPLCWLILLIPVFGWFNKIRTQEGNVFLVAGWLSLFIIPLYVTVYGGVGYFGLRYIEGPFYLLLLGFGIYLKEMNLSNSRTQRWIIVILLLLVGYGNWLSTREGLKILRNSSQENATFQTFLKKSDRLVVHSSLYSSIWMGASFFEKIHVKLIGNAEAEEYLKQIPANEKFVLILSPEDIYISADIPKKLHAHYKTQLDLGSLPMEILEETRLNGIRLVLANKK